MREYTVTENDAGRRADRFVAGAAPDLAAPSIQKAFRKKDVKRNGRPCRAADRLTRGDTVRLYGFGGAPEPGRMTEVPPLAPGQTVYEDGELIVLHKPAGVPSQTGGGEAGIEDMARATLRRRGEWGPENGFIPSLCHRLDRNTEGLLLFAKTAPALRALTEKIRAREVRKTYRCVVEGVPDEPAGEWRDRLWKDAKQNRVYVRDCPGAKEAVLRYKVLQSSGGRSLLEIELVTGRTHQIRVQCASRGFPILGDGKYGRGIKGDVLALCAVRLEFDGRVFAIGKKFADFD